jgi:ferredoxin-NADP reductase
LHVQAKAGDAIIVAATAIRIALDLILHSILCRLLFYYTTSESPLSVRSAASIRASLTLVHEAIPDFRERTFHIFGPQAMVTALREMLRRLGVRNSRIKIDFSWDSREPRPDPRLFVPRQEDRDGQSGLGVRRRQANAIGIDYVGHNGKAKSGAAAIGLEPDAARQCELLVDVGDPRPVVGQFTVGHGAA